MSLGNCIPGLVAEGKLTKQQGERAQAAYDRHYRRLLNQMGPVQAAAEASEAALRELEYEAALKKRQTLLQVQVQKNIAGEIANGDPNRTPIAVVERAELQRRAILGRAHAKMEGILARHRRNLFGETRAKADLADLGREAFGEKTGNAAAAELAAAWRETGEMLRQRFNRAGGNIGKLKDWGLPQVHDMMKVRAATFNDWRAEILPRLDLARMIDDTTGQSFTAEGIEAALRDAYEAIRSDGWSRREPGGMGKGKLANRRADHRFFKFKSFDDWIAYQERFGTGNIFDAMMGHIEGMARDTGLMETLGPNPAATARWLADGIEKASRGGAGGQSVFNRANSARLEVERLYDVISGRLNSPVNATAARLFGGVRAFLTSTLLGSASITAISDVAFQNVTRAYNGLPITGAIRGYLKLLNPLAVEDRKLAVRLGLIAEEASRMASALNRYVDGTHGPEIAMRLSDGVLRASGLSVWTQVGRWAFGMEFLGHLADMRGKGFDALSEPLRAAFGRYGIAAADWDAMRAAKPYAHKGAEFLRPEDIEDAALGDKLLRMVLNETDYAVPTATARSRALTSFGQRPGTIGGELLRNMFLFKNFGVSMILTHGARTMEAKGWNRAKYAANLTISMTLLGAIATQLSEISKGKDAQDMNPLTNPGFWGRAALKGGGFGIFGDFIQSGENRFGGGFAETLAGPVVGAASDLYRAGRKVIGDAIDPGKEANPGKEGVKLAKRYTPGGSLWYLRTAYERLVLDEISAQIDPDYYESWRRMEDRAADEGQGFWWRPGELAPDRLPEAAETPQ